MSSMPVPLLTNWQVLKNYTQQGQMDGVLRRDPSQERDMPHPVRLGQGNGLFQGAAMEEGGTGQESIRWPLGRCTTGSNPVRTGT